MPLGDDDLINFVDRYGDNINKILQEDEDEEDVDEVQIEDQTGDAIQIDAPDTLKQITNSDLENGVNYDGPDKFKGVVYPNVNRVDTIRKWAWVVENDDGTLTAQFSNTFVEDIYGDFFYENDRGRFYHYKCNISNNVRCG